MNFTFLKVTVFVIWNDIHKTYTIYAYEFIIFCKR